jgi:hypothetical protein
MEAFEIDRERQKEQLESYKIVERVVDMRTAQDDGLPEFFCKWTSE